MNMAMSGAKCQSLGLVKTTADGRRINLGVWAFSHKNSVVHWTVNTWIKAKVIWFKARGVI